MYWTYVVNGYAVLYLILAVCVWATIFGLWMDDKDMSDSHIGLALLLALFMPLVMAWLATHG